MAHQVPVARRNVLSEPRRLAASAAGVGLALMLILLLSGLWAGIDAQTTIYEDRTGADLYVAQPGTKNFFSTMSIIPKSTIDQVRADPDVKWAAPIRGTVSVLQLHENKVASYLVGWNPGQQGGPWSLTEGHLPTNDNEVVIGQVLADRHGLKVGDTVNVLGTDFQVSGIGATDTFMLSFVFMTHAATDKLLRSPDTTSFVLVGTDHPDAVRARLASTGLAVVDRDELKANDLAVISRPFSVPLRVMVSVAFAVGSLVIALTAYSALVDHGRDYGIIKALGARRRNLYRLAVTQTMILAVIGLATGAVLFFGGRAFITWIRPQFAITLTAVTLIQTIVAAIAMGLIAAVLPARRLARLDPATAYRGGGVATERRSTRHRRHAGQSGHVPLARRNLFQDRRRAVLAVLGVSAALLLVLVLNGVFAGAMQQVTSKIDTSPADVWVAQQGVRTMHMSTTALPDGTTQQVERVDGVAWVENLRYTNNVVEKDNQRLITYVFGYDPATGRAGPSSLVAGRAPGDGEVVIDQVAAKDLNAQVGDTVNVLGTPLRVSGLSTEGTNIVNTTVYLSLDQFAKLRGPGINYILVGAKPGVSADDLAQRVSAALPNATVQTKAQFSEQERRIVQDMATDLMSIMAVIGFLIALAVIALTLFTVTLSKLREYGIVKALGGTGTRMVTTVATQATWTVLLAAVAAVAGSLLLGWALSKVTDNIHLLIEPSSVARVSILALVAGALAALIPLRRVLSVDPASAFRRPT
jgi:putative ABC transport system permease protein